MSHRRHCCLFDCDANDFANRALASFCIANVPVGVRSLGRIISDPRIERKVVLGYCVTLQSIRSTVSYPKY